MVYSKIMVFGNQILREKAANVAIFDQELKKLVQNMFETMYKARGIGFAAPQIGISKRVMILDITDQEGPKLALINPVIVSKSRLTEIEEEGCLSVPGIRGNVVRAKKIQVRAFDPDGKPLEFSASNLLARVIQHEMDHLDGILFTDRLSAEELALLQGDIEKLKNKMEVSVAQANPK